MTPFPKTTLRARHILQGIALALLLIPATAGAQRVSTFELTIEKSTVNFTGRDTMAMTLNGGIPGPTLRFTEGDTARIHVHNRMDVETSIHWHGLLVPPGMDGVPDLTFPPIAPHSTFTYEFPIRQSGTYWYHSHTMLQEQRGVYGSIVITPLGGEADTTDRDEVVLLSDWTDTDPKAVLRNLRRGSEWSAVERGSGQSILGAARLGMLGDYMSRELQRMPAMDIADVAYDRFLANGQVSSGLPAAPGETLRLRLINGSATTFFHVEFAGGPMTLISADGMEVEPVEVDRLLISVAETYDVLVRQPSHGSYELRATAHDASGYASLWLGDGEPHAAPEVPHPNLYRSMGDISTKQMFSLTPAGVMGMPRAEVEAGSFDRPGMNMEGHDSMSHGSMEHGAMEHGSMEHGAMEHGAMDHGAMEHGAMEHGAMDQGAMDHGAMEHGAMEHGATDHGAMEHGATEHGAMKSGPGTSHIAPEQEGKRFARSFGWLTTDLASRGELADDGMDDARPWPPYRLLRARQATSINSSKPVREIRLTLDGDMERYLWFLNGQPLSRSDDIEIKEGEVVRFIMINRTMMHHPMHLHGHFFRVLNGQGDFAPLKHTVDVEPMSTTVIEFEANEVGDWFFHCHLLYHMMSGMARVVSYQSFVPPADVQAIRSRLYDETWYAWGEAEVMSHMSLGSLMAVDSRNILTAEWEIGWQDVDVTQGEVILTWDRYRNAYFTYFVGLDIEGDSDTIDDPRGVLGLRYLLPFTVESRMWIDSEGEGRIQLEKMFHLTPRLALLAEVEYDSLEGWEGLTRLSYTLNQRLDLLAQWHSDYGVGGGLSLRF